MATVNPSAPSLRLLAVLGLMSAGVLPAQEYRGRVQGAVTDSTQAVVVGASVTLGNVNTGVSTTRTTDQTGRYLFDLVEPGMYRVAVVMEGFNRFVQENVLVENRGDVTVNAVLQVGSVTETVSVSASPVAVKFNTTTMELTMDNTMVGNLPIVARNPFTLALLNPAVVSTYTHQKNPFYMWAASSTEVGGSPTQTGDVLVDGMPVMLGPKSSYAPTMDNTTEVTVQQNSVDAEYGHSSGGVVNVSMKSGTNELHGTAYYFGRNPSLNAVSNPLTRAKNLVRNHIWGGTAGFPIVKNRVFNFFAYERWNQRNPYSDQRRMMTDLERGGDFSQSRNIDGGLCTIYDPWTSRFQGTAAVRQAFPGNSVPRSRMDPSALLFLRELWNPNGPGIDITGSNNFSTAFIWNLNYHNVSDRTDFVLSENLRGFFRYSRFRTYLKIPNWTPNKSRLYTDPNSGTMHSLNVSADVIWTVSPSTVVNLRTNYTSLNDDFDAPESYATLDAYREFFPQATDFYTRYLDIGAPFYYPGMSVDGGGGYGKGSWWFQHPQASFFAGKISKQMGPHYLKVGAEFRNHRTDAIVPNTFNFHFRPHETAATWISPNTRLSGDSWASFLLGAANPGSSWARHMPFRKDTANYLGLFIQDDFKLSRNITLNLGLRYEYESAIYDRGGSFGKSTFEPNRYSRGLDPGNPIPEFQGAGQPKLPAAALALMDRPYQWNGAWMFADDSNRGMWDPQKLILLPRAGIAVRLSDRMSLRVGWARFITPQLLQRPTGNAIGSTPVPGFAADTPMAPHIDGVPAQRLSNPFPADVNPIVMPIGKGDGRYTLMGADAIWDKRDLKAGANDRFNFTFQRETVARFVVEGTYFMNVGRDRPYSLELNQVNPVIINREGRAITQAAPNPFYNLLPLEKMRGPLRNRTTVSLSELLKPYPHYGVVRQVNTDGVRERYHSLQLRVQRPFANGLNFLLAYNYNQEKSEEYFNKEEQFVNTFRWEDASRPRHRMSLAGTWEAPIGRGRPFMNSLHPVLDAVVGGWTASAIFWYNAGDRLRFGMMEVVGEPAIDDLSKWGYMFNPKAFQFITDSGFKVRTNPKSYPGVQGPGYKSLDLTLSKFFRVTERIQLELRMEAYNATNTFSGANPSTDVTAATFGRVTAIRAGTQGREHQYNIRLHF
ncbi:MAG: carboxypeptidase regulatory-like domain-containing protein [Acidobacteria bacterium]|nr:carboxypeptidase regulatory-like domain-containing protein [Acidobacteriota bacterium]